jgi:Lipase (class 3)
MSDLDLLYAELADDAYNRSIDDIPFALNAIGTATGNTLAPFNFNSTVTGLADLDAIGLVSAVDTETNVATGFVYSKSGNGFGAQVIQDGTNLIVTFRGTDFGDAGNTDLTQDAAIGLATSSANNQAQNASDLIQYLQSHDPGASITVTGHSLGGGLAVLVGARYDLATYAFDAAPFGKQLWYIAIKDALASVDPVTGMSKLLLP